MIKTSIEKLANSIGYDIGTSDDVVQSDLLNGFFKGIHNSMQSNDRAMQLCYISEKLTKESEEILMELVEFVKLKKTDK